MSAMAEAAPLPRGRGWIDTGCKGARAARIVAAARTFMSSLKQYKLAAKSLLQQQEVITELDALVKDIERCEKTILDLKTDLEAVNEKHASRKTTREDIAYLEDLLKCAHKKLTWEKHMASLKKRTPATLQKMSGLINDPEAPPSDEVRGGMLRALQAVQAAMERLEKVKVG
jgi:hypothetical protein